MLEAPLDAPLEASDDEPPDRADSNVCSTVSDAVLMLTRGVRSVFIVVVVSSSTSGSSVGSWPGSLSGLGSEIVLAFGPVPFGTFTLLLTRSRSELIF